MKRPNLLQRAMDRFAADPSSVKNAVYVMIVITVGIVLVGGVIVWLFDRRDFPDLGSALWYTLQTVTTVGYGDMYPVTPIGKAVGALTAVLGIGMFALPCAILGAGFIEELDRNKKAQRCPHCGKEIGGTP